MRLNNIMIIASHLQVAHCLLRKVVRYFVVTSAFRFASAYAKSLKKSERQDLNLRPLPPQGSALPGCATSRFYINFNFFEPEAHYVLPLVEQYSIVLLGRVRLRYIPILYSFYTQKIIFQYTYLILTSHFSV